MSWTVLFTKQAQKDPQKLASTSPALRQKAQTLLDLLVADPFQQPPPFEALVSDLHGAFSRRVNIQHRLVDQVLAEQQIVKVLRMWSHCESLSGIQNHRLKLNPRVPPRQEQLDPNKQQASILLAAWICPVGIPRATAERRPCEC